ncbi:DUF2911 domain-containing protein [Maribacter sp. CXY002]|uniref:DUF2911 domain-containing protein n=1 Tax=Maribacter luteocoastalis TaxID=3407671 RepID=UPI003B66B0FA
MRVVVFLLFFSLSTISWSQIQHPKASPAAIIEQEVGLSKIKISYSRPSARGRKIFGTRADGEPGLVPYGRIWRVGANESTKITIDTDSWVMGKLLPKGTYALYAFPEENLWEIVFHKNTGHWGDGRAAYNPVEDALRVQVKPIKTLGFQENFLIAFDDITHNALTMVLFWEHTKVQIPIHVDTRDAMEKQIAKQLVGNPTAQTFYEIARYYQEEGINYLQALKHIDKALELGGDTYYFYRIKSLIEAELGDYKSAISSAQRSLVLADEEGKDEFVRLNDKSIKDWTFIIKTN